MNAIKDRLYEKVSKLLSDSKPCHETIDQDSEANDKKSPVLSFVLPSASLDWIRTSARSGVANEPTFSSSGSGSGSWKRRNKTLSSKNEPLDTECHIGNEPGSGTSTSSRSDVFEDVITHHALQKAAPSCPNESSFVSRDLFDFFEAALPNIVKGCRWVRLYSTARDGISLQTLFRKSACVNGPFLLITGDEHGAIFGGLLDGPLRPTSKRKYQGTNWCFVFTTLYGEPRLFRPTGANRYFYLCLDDLIALGGGANFALSLNEDL